MNWRAGAFFFMVARIVFMWYAFKVCCTPLAAMLPFCLRCISEMVRGWSKDVKLGGKKPVKAEGIRIHTGILFAEINFQRF